MPAADVPVLGEARERGSDPRVRSVAPEHGVDLLEDVLRVLADVEIVGQPKQPWLTRVCPAAFDHEHPRAITLARLHELHVQVGIGGVREPRGEEQRPIQRDDPGSAERGTPAHHSIPIPREGLEWGGRVEHLSEEPGAVPQRHDVRPHVGEQPVPGLVLIGRGAVRRDEPRGRRNVVAAVESFLDGLDPLPVSCVRVLGCEPVRAQELVVHPPRLPSEVGENGRPCRVDDLGELLAAPVRDGSGEVEQIVLGLLEIGQRAAPLIQGFEDDPDLGERLHLVDEEPERGRDPSLEFLEALELLLVIDPCC